MPVVGWIVLGIAVIAVAVVAVVALSSAGGGTAAAPVGTASAAPHDAVWVQETQRDATVQVFACSDVTKSTCDDTFGWGSGSIIDADLGLVLTNFHVIANDDASQPLSEVSVTVRTNSGEELEAEVVGFSACDDLAVIKITQASDRAGLKQVTFADPASIKPGEAVVALGYPGTTQSEAGGMEAANADNRQRLCHRREGIQLHRPRPDGHGHQPRQLWWAPVRPLRQAGWRQHPRRT